MFHGAFFLHKLCRRVVLLLTREAVPRGDTRRACPDRPSTAPAIHQERSVRQLCQDRLDCRAPSHGLSGVAGLRPLFWVIRYQDHRKKPTFLVKGNENPSRFQAQGPCLGHQTFFGKEKTGIAPAVPAILRDRHKEHTLGPGFAEKNTEDNVKGLSIKGEEHRITQRNTGIAEQLLSRLPGVRSVSLEGNLDCRVRSRFVGAFVPNADKRPVQVLCQGAAVTQSRSSGNLTYHDAAHIHPD